MLPNRALEPACHYNMVLEPHHINAEEVHELSRPISFTTQLIIQRTASGEGPTSEVTHTIGMLGNHPHYQGIKHIRNGQTTMFIQIEAFTIQMLMIMMNMLPPNL